MKYYAVADDPRELYHYGVKGMKWGVRKAIQSGSDRALRRQYKKASKKLDSAVIAINSMLAQIYKNKSTDEYKMKGDISRSPSYKQIEEMIADLKTLKGYSQNDANDMAKLFNTLHRPVFKTMVKEYITDPNDKNTVFTSMFTIGYRLLVGELARIFAATEATDKGIVYKPNKMSRKEDASKLIKLFNDDLEQKLNNFVRDMKKHPEDSPVNEAYIEMFLDRLYQEAEEVESTDQGAPGPVEEADNSAQNDALGNLMKEFIKSHKDVKTVKLDDVAPPTMKDKIAKKIEPAAVKEADEEQMTDGSPDTIKECDKIKRIKEDTEMDDSSNSDTSDDSSSEPEYSDSVATESAIVTEASLAGATASMKKFSDNVSAYSSFLGVFTGAAAMLGGLFAGAVGLLKGFNPISDINYLFMNSYDKKVASLGNIARMYETTKKAYEEYMKIPEAQRKKKVESKYIKDLEKYNIQMNNLAAQIEHYNSRAKKESQEVVADVEKKMPSDKVPQGGGSGNTVDTDDDFQF